MSGSLTTLFFFSCPRLKDCGAAIAAPGASRLLLDTDPVQHPPRTLDASRFHSSALVFFPTTTLGYSRRQHPPSFGRANQPAACASHEGRPPTVGARRQRRP